VGLSSVEQSGQLFRVKLAGGQTVWVHADGENIMDGVEFFA
jgi:hypothetical protein